MSDNSDKMESSSLSSSSNSNSRSLEKIEELLMRAKLDSNDLKPICQSIYFGQTVASDDLKLLEVDQTMLDYLLEGNCLVIRGDITEYAVCCTQNTTYSLKVAEISNPLLVNSNLIIPDKNDDSKEKQNLKSQIVFMTNSYFAINKEKPKLQKLKNLLDLNLYSGKAIDDNNDSKKYTINDFLDIIQSSEEEIYNYLNFIEAFQIDGHWRLLDYKFFNEVMDNILKFIDERSFSFDKIPIKELYKELSSIYGLSILKQIAIYYFDQIEEMPDFYKLNKEKVMKFYAESLLRSTLKMNYIEFLSIIRKSLPSEFKFDFNLSAINDICYVEEPYIYYLNALDLPDEIEKRFKVLFEKRKKWPSEDLAAFIKDLCSNDQTEINNQLTKFCRPFTQNNIKYYTSRFN